MRCRFFGLFGRGEDYYIPWDCVQRFGEDIILIDKPFQRREGEKKKRRELEKQRDVRKEMQSLVKSGMNEHDALGLAEQKVSLTYKIEDKREREKKEKEASRARAQEISDAFKTRFDAVQQTLSSVSRVGSGFGSLFPLVGKEGAGLSAAVDSLTGEVKKSNEYLRTIAEKAEKGGVALFS